MQPAMQMAPTAAGVFLSVIPVLFSHQVTDYKGSHRSKKHHAYYSDKTDGNGKANDA